jgi:hypothetical protein
MKNEIIANRDGIRKEGTLPDSNLSGRLTYCLYYISPPAKTTCIDKYLEFSNPFYIGPVCGPRGLSVQCRTSRKGSFSMQLGTRISLPKKVLKVVPWLQLEPMMVLGNCSSRTDSIQTSVQYGRPPTHHVLLQHFSPSVGGQSSA